MDKQVVSHLLQQVSLLARKHKDISKITGSDFNIFSILRMEYDEVGLHSRFIGELLNPNGAHGQGGKFQRIFLEMLREEVDGFSLNYEDEDINNSTILIEQNIGGIVDDYSKGGRIDIVIKPKSNAKELVIENKINAGDQLKQLLRYHRNYENGIILYLTLEGGQPNEISIKDESLELKEGKHFHCISYKSHIVKWLEKCLMSAFNLPMLRETITQYLNLIKMLTGQAMDKHLKEEIKQILLQDKNYAEATKICHEALNELVSEIHEKFLDAFEKQKVDEKIGDRGAYEIFFEISEDSDGIFWGFYAKKDGKTNVSNNEDLKDLVNVIKNIHPKAKSNGNYLGFWFPKEPIRHITQLPIEDIYKLNRPEDRNAFIDQIFEQSNLIREQFINYFKLKPNEFKLSPNLEEN